MAEGVGADARTMAVGHITSDGTTVGERQGGFEGNKLLLSDIASAPGGSGGPVFDSKTHLLIGLTSRGARGVAAARWHLPDVEGESPVADVVADIQARLKTGKIAPEARRLVRSWLGPDIKP